MNSELQIVITALDQASDILKGISSSITGVGTAADDTSQKLSDMSSGLTTGGGTLAAIGAGMLTPIYSILKATGDTQASSASLNASLQDNLTVVDDAAKGQGFLATELSSAKTQAALAADALNKLSVGNVESTTKATANSDKLSQLNTTLSDQQQKLIILEGEHTKAGTATQNHALAVEKLNQDIQKTHDLISAQTGKVASASTVTVKGTPDQIDQAQQKYDIASAKLQVLQGRMDDNGKSATQLAANLQPAIDAGVKMGFTVDDTQNALKVLSATMGTKMAGEALAGAEGMVRFSNNTIDLTSAAKMLGTAMETGMGKSLTTYGVVVKDGVGGTQLMGAAIAQTKSQVEAFSQTLEGKLATAWATLNNTQTDAGKSLTNVLGELIDGITKIILIVASWIDKHQELTKNILIFVAVAGTMLIILGSIAIAAGLLISAFGAAGAAIVIAIGLIVAIVVADVAVIIANWGKVQSFMISMWGDIEKAWDTAITWLMNKIQPLLNAINTVVGGAKSLGATVGNAVSGTVGGIAHAIGLATGGIVNSPTLALIGESGPEAVVPLSGSGFSGYGGGGNGSINISVGNLFGTDQAAARNFVNQIAKLLNQQLHLKTY